jgi:4-amino-4-deoxy-L-arabinose transferase-like glycosyltransferase
LFDLTPPAKRPYAGSTHHNSMLELALRHNGLDRFNLKSSREPVTRDGDTSGSMGVAPDAAPTAAPMFARPTALWDQTPVGPLRLATPQLAAQIGWWLPLAIAGVALGGLRWRWRRRLSAAQADVLLWAGWALTYAAAFSFAGGVFHTYYLAVLGAPLAALAGIGMAGLWQRWRASARHWRLTAVLLITAAWQAFIELGSAGWRFDDWRAALLMAATGGLVAAAGGMAALPPHRSTGRLSASTAMLALSALLLLPLAWALSTVLVRPNVAAPAADIRKLPDSASDSVATERLPQVRSRKLLEFLRTHRRSEKYLLAVPNAQQAAPLILRTGESVMAIGGYLGRDPILTPSQLERLVDDGELRFAIVGGPSIVPPDTPREQALAHWIRSHGLRVEAALWRETPEPNRGSTSASLRSREPARLYDLRPDPAGPGPEVPGP